MTRDAWRRHPGAAAAWAVNTCLAGLLGIAPLIYPERFTAASYSGMRDSLGVTGWGILLCLYAVVLASAYMLPAQVTRWIFTLGGAPIYLALAGYFALTTTNDPLVSPWGVTVFAAIGVWQLGQSEAYRQPVPS